MPVEKMPVQNRLNAWFNYTSTLDENTAATCSPTEKYHRLPCRFRCDSQNRTIGKCNLPHGRKNISKSRNIGKKNCASVHSWEMKAFGCKVCLCSINETISVCVQHPAAKEGAVNAWNRACFHFVQRALSELHQIGHCAPVGFPTIHLFSVK